MAGPNIHVLTTAILVMLLTSLYNGEVVSGLVSTNNHDYRKTVRTDSGIPSTFTAAVYQHAVLNWLPPSITREEALGLMNENVDVYQEQIIIASAKGVSMIVFPESGITGLDLSNKTIASFAEFVPNPYEREIIPCNQTELQDSPILQRLSCLARKHSIVVIANLASKEPCKKSLQDPDCPLDGMHKFNTDVALGTDGKLLAKYNKENLYTEELYIFQPGKGFDNLGVFKTEFGIFGLFTCFDMLFEQPAELLINGMGITNMIFPTAWMNELPLLSAVEYQQAWAISFDVNLLASNIQYPLILMTGGGLYRGKEGTVVYHHDMTDFRGTLLIGQLPIRSQSTPKMNSVDMRILRTKIKNLTPDELLKVSPIVKATLFDGLYSAPFNESEKRIDDVIHHTDSSSSSSQSSSSSSQSSSSSSQSSSSSSQSSSSSSQSSSSSSQSSSSSSSCAKPFTSQMNHDPYTFVLLTQNIGRTSVCSKGLCCHLSYTFATSSSQREMFALGVFNGLHMNNGQYYIQACALVKCRFDSMWSCGAGAVKSETRLESWSLAGEGFDPSTVLFPSVLTSDVHLPVIGKEWESVPPYARLWSETVMREPLLEASIFGRWYAKD